MARQPHGRPFEPFLFIIPLPMALAFKIYHWQPQVKIDEAA
jgi:hypothetical protein